MEFETYADVIDAYNADDMGYSSLTDYIRDQNIKIKEIDMDPMGDFEKILGRKDGGMMIAIEQLGKGGITGGKTYHQYHDQFVPRDEESMGYANGGGVGSMMKPKKKIPQLVKPNKDGSRPGYRGPGGYQGGATNQGGAGKGSSGSSGNTGGGGGGNTNRERGIMSRYQGPKGTTKSISNFRDTGPDRSAVGQFSQYGKNVMNQNLTKNNPSRKGGIGGFLSGIIPTLLGFVNPFIGMAARGIMGIPKGIINFNNKIQNSDFGKSTSLADYLDMRSYGGFDERELARKNTMDSAKDLQARIDAGEFGGPSLNTNTAPKTNVSIQGTNLNDFEIGDPGKYSTADALTEANMADYQTSLVNEFTPYGIDRTNLYEDFADNRDLISETATSPQFNTSLINEFGVKDRGTFDANEGLQFGSIPGNTNQGFGLMNSDAAKAAAMAVMSNAFNENVMPGTSDMGYPDRNMNFLDQGELTASLPGNNLVAEITQADIDRFKQPMTQMMDYDTYKSINTDSTLTPDEFNQLKAQV